MRDAISLLELCAGNHTTVTEELVATTVGSGGRENIVNVVRSVASADYDTIFAIIDDAVRSSKDITVFWQELISFYRDMLVFKTTRAADKYLDLTDSEREMLSEIASLFTKETLLAHCRMLDDSLYTMQRAGSVKRIVAEMTLIKMCDHTLDGGADNILSRLSKLEMAIATGSFVRAAAEPVRTVEKKEPVIEQKKASKTEKTPEKTEKAVTPDAPARVIRGWGEIAKRAVGEDGYLLSFLKIAKGYVTAERKVSVRFPNDFALEMIDKAGVKERLCSVLNVELQTSFDARDIVYEVSSDVGGTAPDDLDSFDM